MTPQQIKLAAFLWEHGFKNTDAIVKAQSINPTQKPILSACCALLINETAGGNNIWGGEGTACPKEWWEHPVTEAQYKTYKVNLSHGMTPNGCGPTQLTDPSLQADADALGGCWEPEANMRVGFHFLWQKIQAAGSEWAGFRDYNGSGPAAEAYADKAVREQARIHLLLTGHGF